MSADMLGFGFGALLFLLHGYLLRWGFSKKRAPRDLWDSMYGDFFRMIPGAPIRDSSKP